MAQPEEGETVVTREEVPTHRIEGFSDGVFSIILTLLVLEVRVPVEAAEEIGLARALVAQWPSYLGFVLSFLVVGVTWVNHHGMFNHIRRSGHGLLVLNLLLLLSVSVLPFTSALLADYVLGTPTEQQLAAAVYSATFALGGVLFNAVWWHALRAGLVDERLSPEERRAITRYYLRGPMLFFVAFGLAFVSVTASLALYALLVGSFFLPQRARLGRS